MIPPNDRQWEAVRDTDHHLLVVSGAGTGKTHTIVWKILWLLGVEVRGERIASPLRLRDLAAITFTNQAARELTEALRRALAEHGRTADAVELDRARIGTIHGFCTDVLRDHALRRGRPPLRTVLEEGDAAALAMQVARDALVEALETDSVPELQALLGMWRTTDVDGWVVQLLGRPDLVRRKLAQPDDPTVEERALLGVAALALRRLDEYLEREGAIDFDHMIHWTRDLLRDEPLVRQALQRRIRVLLIDEFQDVDPVQKEIAYLLAEPATRAPTTTRLVLVGDPKQSIYRFRHADVAAWNEVQRDFEVDGMGRVVALEQNYRSVPGILALVDATVGRLLDTPLMGDSLQPFEVPFLSVQAARAADANLRPVEFLLVPPNEEGKSRKIEEIRDIEADTIATRARELHREGVAWKDMALLFATWTSVRKYEAALSRSGVPCYALRGEGFLDTREVLDLVLALETVRDPTDERALMGFLRSPFVGLRDDTLLHIARSAPRPFWRHLHHVDVRDERALALGELLGGVRFEETEAERLGRAAALLRRIAQLRDRIPAAEMLRELLHQSGYLGHLALLGEDGRQALANVRQFLEMASNMNHVGVGDLLRAVRERRARGDRIAQARLYAATDDVVTITSIHVAKGLEWDVVFWCDLARGTAAMADKLLVTRDAVRLGLPDIQPDEQALTWSTLRVLLQLEMQAEQKRLWYVAATRARDRLILSGIPQGSGDPHKQSFAYAVLDEFPSLDSATTGAVMRYRDQRGALYEAVVRVADPVGTRDPREVLVPTPDEALVSSAAAEPAPIDGPWSLELPQPELSAPVGEPRHSATEFLTHARCARRHWFKYIAGIREPELAASQREELISAVRRGQIVHDVLERYEEELELAMVLEDAIGRWDENAPPPESTRGREYREHLREEVSSVLEHPDYRALAANPGARRELPFLYLHENGIAARGWIDLAAPAGESIELLDVKTIQCGAEDAPARAAHYSPQVDVYATAVSAISGRPVRRFSFQFSHAGVQVARELSDADLAEAARRFEATSSEIARGAPPLTSHPEECRFCGYRNVGLCPGARSTNGPDARGPGSEANIAALLARLKENRYRARFHLHGDELRYLRERGFTEVTAQARRIVRERLAPARPDNDGRQTPWRGHPVFVAQHATATCCRSCLEKWHRISQHEALTEDQIAYAVKTLGRWLREQDGGQHLGPRSEQLSMF